MKISGRIWILALAFLGTQASADPKAAADYIVSQTVTQPIFEGAILAQKPLITGALQNQMRENGIRLKDPDRFFDLFLSEFMDEFVESMQAQSAQIFLDNFSESELNDIAAFMKTPSGQAYVAATPTLMQQGAEMGQRAGAQAGLNAG
ncbi:MAG: DUF2059 domain-containing protein, partial [Pseudomonadota bacterium]